jgi:hypothetical protein
MKDHSKERILRIEWTSLEGRRPRSLGSDYVLTNYPIPPKLGMDWAYSIPPHRS